MSASLSLAAAEIGEVSMYKVSPRFMKILLNIYGPYLGAGVRVNHIASDWKELRVSMKLRWFNRNAVGTHFGGSLYSMVDPHLMLMLMQLLGPEYTVWDKSASIDFVRPGKGKVNSVLTLSDAQVSEVKERAENGRPLYPEFEVEIHNESGELVAKVLKTLYVRKKKAA